jgi:hypothetical protein
MSFITGNAFKNLAHYIFDEKGFRKNRETKGDTPIFFVKTDYIFLFFDNKTLLPNYKFKLITHNSDNCIGSEFFDYISKTNLKKWFAQNVNYKHPKLIPIPIGIANEEWPHGDVKILQSIMDQKHKKNQLMYANFNIHTNPKQRRYCLENIKPEYVKNNSTFEIYLTQTAQSYFSICPMGNGIDSHRIWESLYLKTIPIVENTYNISYLKKQYDLPIILLNDWNELKNINLCPDMYFQKIENFDMNRIKKIEALIYE